MGDNCPVCLDPCEDPVAGPCAHGMCRGCAIRALTRRPECPICREVLRGRDVVDASGQPLDLPDPLPPPPAKPQEPPRPPTPLAASPPDASPALNSPATQAAQKTNRSWSPPERRTSPAQGPGRASPVLPPSRSQTPVSGLGLLCPAAAVSLPRTIHSSTPERGAFTASPRLPSLGDPSDLRARGFPLAPRQDHLSPPRTGPGNLSARRTRPLTDYPKAVAPPTSPFQFPVSGFGPPSPLARFGPLAPPPSPKPDLRRVAYF